MSFIGAVGSAAQTSVSYDATASSVPRGGGSALMLARSASPSTAAEQVGAGSGNAQLLPLSTVGTSARWMRPRKQATSSSNGSVALAPAASTGMAVSSSSSSSSCNGSPPRMLEASSSQTSAAAAVVTALGSTSLGISFSMPNMLPSVRSVAGTEARPLTTNEQVAAATFPPVTSTVVVAPPPLYAAPAEASAPSPESSPVTHVAPAFSLHQRSGSETALHNASTQQQQQQQFPYGAAVHFNATYPPFAHSRQQSSAASPSFARRSPHSAYHTPPSAASDMFGLVTGGAPHSPASPYAAAAAAMAVLHRSASGTSTPSFGLVPYAGHVNGGGGGGVTPMDMQHAVFDPLLVQAQHDLQLMQHHCVTVAQYAHDSDLCADQLSRHLHVSDFIGIDELRARILDTIFRSSTRTEAQVGLYLNNTRVFVCQAPFGSGVRTAVHSFCAENRINLVVIDGKVPPTDDSDRAVMRWVRAKQPCVVMVHRLDARNWDDSQRVQEAGRLLALWQAQQTNMPLAWLLFVHQGVSPALCQTLRDYRPVVLATVTSAPLILALLRRVTEWQLRLLAYTDDERRAALAALDPTFVLLAQDTSTFSTYGEVVHLLADAFLAQRNAIPSLQWTTHQRHALVLTAPVLSECYRARVEDRRRAIQETLDREAAAAAAAVAAYEAPMQP